jgi:hypothetical protein
VFERLKTTHALDYAASVIDICTLLLFGYFLYKETILLICCTDGLPVLIDAFPCLLLYLVNCTQDSQSDV